MGLDGKAAEMKKQSLGPGTCGLHFYWRWCFLFLSYHFNKEENEVLLQRTRIVEDEKPFKDVAGTENDVRSRPVDLQLLSTLVSVM